MSHSHIYIYMAYSDISICHTRIPSTWTQVYVSHPFVSPHTPNLFIFCYSLGQLLSNPTNHLFEPRVSILPLRAVKLTGMWWRHRHYSFHISENMLCVRLRMPVFGTQIADELHRGTYYVCLCAYPAFSGFQYFYEYDQYNPHKCLNMTDTINSSCIGLCA